MKSQPIEAQPLEKSSPGTRDLALSRSLLSHPVFLFLVDLSIALVAFFLAWTIRTTVQLPWTQDLLPEERWGTASHPWLVLVLSQAFFLYILGLYDDLRVTRYRETLAQVFLACLFQLASFTFFFYFSDRPYPRTVILIFVLLNFAGLCIWRFYVKSQLRKGVSRVLVVSRNPENAREIVRDIRATPWTGLRVVGLAVASRSGEPVQDLGCPLLGRLEEIPEIVLCHDVDEIVFASEPTWKDEVLDSLGKLQVELPLRISIMPSVYELVIGRLRHLNIRDTPLIQVRRHPNEPFERFVKRTFDIILSLVCLVLGSPFLLILPMLIRISSSDPVFYLQERVGCGGRVFRLIKFRTMIPNAEDGSGETLAVLNDPRVTLVGRFLRRFRLDEMPQLFNVLKGDMSFVGPRPERPGFVAQFAERVPGYGDRHRVKPGITGLAQVSSSYHSSVENKLKYDLAYIYNYSFTLDLVILLETIKVILIRKGS